MVKSTVKTSRLDANASQMMKTISITAVREMNEPIDEIVFHICMHLGSRTIWHASTILRLPRCIQI